MAAKWIGKSYKPEAVLAQVERQISVNSKGQLVSDAFYPLLDEATTYFLSAMSFNATIPETERFSIVSGALKSAIKGRGPLSTSGIRRRVTNLEQAYLARPKEDYVISTGLSLRYFGDLAKRQTDDCRISFTRHLPPRFARAIKTDFQSPNYPWEVKVPSGYTAVRISAKALSPAEALDKAINAYDYIRGLWNLRLNYLQWSVSFVPHTPVNQLTGGPFHVVHHPDGKTAGHSFWYEHAAVSPRSARSSRHKWNSVVQSEGDLRRRVTRSPLASDLKLAIARYCRALDEPRLDISLVKLWGLLETLTETTRRSSEDTIRRTLFLSAGSELDGEVLRQLANTRNLTVHAGKESDYVQSMVTQLRRYVERLLLFLVNNGSEFGSLAEAGKVFDLPPDHSVLSEEVSSIRKAMKLLRPSTFG